MNTTNDATASSLCRHGDLDIAESNDDDLDAATGGFLPIPIVPIVEHILSSAAWDGIKAGAKALFGGKKNRC